MDVADVLATAADVGGEEGGSRLEASPSHEEGRSGRTQAAQEEMDPCADALPASEAGAQPPFDVLLEEARQTQATDRHESVCQVPHRHPAAGSAPRHAPR